VQRLILNKLFVFQFGQAQKLERLGADLVSQVAGSSNKESPSVAIEINVSLLESKTEAEPEVRQRLCAFGAFLHSMKSIAASGQTSI